MLRLSSPRSSNHRSPCQQASTDAIVKITRAGTATGWTAAVTSGFTGLSIVNPSGTTPSDLIIRVTTPSLGTYSGTVRVQANDSSIPGATRRAGDCVCGGQGLLLAADLEVTPSRLRSIANPGDSPGLRLLVTVCYSTASATGRLYDGQQLQPKARSAYDEKTI